MAVAAHAPHESVNPPPPDVIDIPSRGRTPLALTVGIGMLLTIAGTVAVGPIVAYLSIVPLVVGVLVYAGRDPVIATALLFAYLAMEGMYKYVSDFSQAIYVINPLLMGAVVVSWLLALHRQGKRLAAPPLGGVLALLVGWAVVQVFNPLGSGLVGGLATAFLFYIGPVMFYLIGNRAAISSRQVETACYVMIGVCTVVSLFAVVQFAMGQAWTESHVPGYTNCVSTNWFSLDDKGAVTASSFRPASTTPMGGGSSLWSMIGMVSAAGLIFSPALSPHRKIGLALCLLVNTLGLLVDGVRLWVVSGACSVLFFIVITSYTPRQLLRNVGLVLGAFLVCGIAFAGAQTLSNGTISSRYAATAADPLAKFQHDRGYNVTAISTLVTAYPLGIGYQYGLGKQDTDARMADKNNAALAVYNGETQFGAVAGDMGVPGVVLLYLLVIGLLVIGWRSFRRLRSPHLRTVAAMLLALLFAYVPAGFGGPCLKGSVHFWFVAGLLTALPGIERRERAKGR